MTTPDRDSHARHDDEGRYARARGAASDAVESNPLAVLAGGIALGAVVGALIPRSAKEKELLAPVGRELSTRARAAVDAAREAGKSEMSELGLTKGAAKDQAKNLFQNIAKAATTAGAAAAKTASTNG